MVGRSPQIEQVRRLVMEVADSPVDVLIHGETGTGKEVVAQALHEFSRRKGAPFVALNCGGVPDTLLDSELFGHEQGAFTGAQKRRIGKIEYASGGTLFLDELETMPLPMQIKLLRVLQERRIERLGSNQGLAVDVRVVAATKDDLQQRAREGSFRLDLYYRLMAHAWPGNVRELRNVAGCLVLGVRKDVLGPAPAAASGEAEAEGLSLAETVDGFERSLIAAELPRHDGSIARTAKTTLADKVRKYGLQASGG